MAFLISLCIVVVFVLTSSDYLRKRPLPFYLGAAAFSVGIAFLSLLDIKIPSGIENILMPVLKRGGLVGALFAVVMFAGAFPQGSFGAKKFMPVRAQLSIIASIFAIGHSLSYSKFYLTKIFGKEPSASVLNIVTFLLALVMLGIMLPLFITSFKNIRKRMDAKKWKKLQRTAYAFYGLIFLHVILLSFPKAIRGDKTYVVNVLVYGFVFMSYLFCRIIRALYKNEKTKMVRSQLISVAGMLFAACISFAAVFAGSGSRAADNIDVKKLEMDVADDYAYKDGTYYGEAMGMNADIGVEVTIAEGKIADIRIVKFGDDEEYFDSEKDGDKMALAVMGAQSISVDTISGATYSSAGYLDAVEKALEEASK